MQESSWNPKKYFGNRVKSFVTCYLCQQSAYWHFPAIFCIQNGERKRLETSSTMFCHKCGREFGNNETFCLWCGTLKRHEQESVLSSAEGERLAIEHYFKRGFFYETIVHFLADYQWWDFNELEDFEQKATSLWVTKKKPPSFRTHCSGNN